MKTMRFYCIVFGIGCISNLSHAVSNYDITLPSYPPGETLRHPSALNDLNQIAGPNGALLGEAYLWQNGNKINIPFPASDLGIAANDINNAGHAIGGNFVDAGMLWNGSQLIDLGTLGGNQSNAVAINDDNEVVGWSEIANGYQHAFIWKNGVMTELGTLGGNQSQAFDINNSGQVIGWAETATGYRPLVIWESGTAVRLNGLIAPDSGWELVMTESIMIDIKPSYDINNNGAVLGTGFINGGSYPFLMLPRSEDFFLHDSNHDGTVNMQDFAQLSNEWME